MPTVEANLAALRRLLVRHCAFKEELFEDNYRLGGGARFNWAGFTHQPFDARSACVAAFAIEGDSHDGAMHRRLLGAPVLFAVGEKHYEVWRLGRDDAVAVERSLSCNEITGFVQGHKEELNRNRLYQAKTQGRLPDSDRQLPLFVDPGVLVYAESELGDRLASSVDEAVHVLAAGTEQIADWAFKATFRLLAAKILKDKQVPGFKSANLFDVEKSLLRVEKHYGSHDPLAIQSCSQRNRAVEAVRILNQPGDLRNLTAESLADVYEKALITPDTRNAHGTHKTPAYLVDYIVWQLGDWIAEIPTEELRFFEPACGHAPFLVSAMRLLRTLDLGLPPDKMSTFLRERLLGVEVDAFALEIARLSLTVADEPNPNGWNGLKEDDMFTGDYLESTAKTSMVLLTNPPYEKGKAQSLLERTLPHLPVGAVFGVVVPATFLFSDKNRPKELREWLIRHCQLGEISLFPDGIFSFADQECTILLGRRLPDRAPLRSMRTRLRRVREYDREGFQKDYKVTTSRLSAQSRFAAQPGSELWIPESSDEIWTWLGHLPTLQTIATIGKGLEYKGGGEAEDARTIRNKPFAESVEGFDSSEGNWNLHECPTIRFFSLDNAAIRRPGSGVGMIPQVLVNYAPVGRGVWRLKPFIDSGGKAFTSRFVSVRPKNKSYPIEFLWAVCNSPVAHFYIYTHTLKREIRIVTLRRLPIVPLAHRDVERVSQLACRYLKMARQGPSDMFNKQGYSDCDLVDCLRTLDAEILRLYDLPAQAERWMLDQFAGEQRPGVPVPFTSYYPEDFRADVPLYVYLSKTFQQGLRGKTPELTNRQEERYDTLVAKADAGSLTDAEADELDRLQAEVDGRDYALQMIGKSNSREAIDHHPSADARLKQLDDRLASASLWRARKSS
jgi:hypothetical protein